MSKHHIVAIDNDYGHIEHVSIHSSYDTRVEAEAAFARMAAERHEFYDLVKSLEKENRERYLEWGSRAVVECPNEYGGVNWVMKPKNPNHDGWIKQVPQHIVNQHNNQKVVSHRMLRITGDEPLILLEIPKTPPELFWEYHLAS